MKSMITTCYFREGGVDSRQGESRHNSTSGKPMLRPCGHLYDFRLALRSYLLRWETCPSSLKKKRCFSSISKDTTHQQNWLVFKRPFVAGFEVTSDTGRRVDGKDARG